MQFPRMTIRGMMLAVAAVAAVFGAIFNAPWLIPLVVITSPQTIIVAACAYQAVREGKDRSDGGPEESDKR
jgi:hypothetical protein